MATVDGIAAPPYPAGPAPIEVVGGATLSTGTPPPARPNGGAFGVGAALSPAGAGSGEGSPAGNRELKPAGLGKGDGSPDGLGKGEPGVPGAMAVGAAGCGTACTLPRVPWAWLAQAMPTKKAAAQARRNKIGEMAVAFMAGLAVTLAPLDERSHAADVSLPRASSQPSRQLRHLM